MIRVGVPSGVGDVYWCLTKLRAFAAGERVTLCVQKSQYDRARQWAEMVDFVHAAEEVQFKPGIEALQTGFGGPQDGMDCVMWPNAVIDRGERIETWLPHLPTDLSFAVKRPSMGRPRVLVYASSMQVATKWMGHRSGAFWNDVVNELRKKVGPVTLIGADWDRGMAAQIYADEKLIGATTLQELAGIVAEARLVVGVISGLTILANHFRTPCAVVWHDMRFPPGFPSAWVAEDAPYRALPATTLNALGLADAGCEVARSAP